MYLPSCGSWDHPDYVDHLDNTGFYTPGFVNGALCMSIALLGPGGASALAATTDQVIVRLAWHYIPVVLASSAVLLG
jgi:hypothetical protein